MINIPKIPFDVFIHPVHTYVIIKYRCYSRYIEVQVFIKALFNIKQDANNLSESLNSSKLLLVVYLIFPFSFSFFFCILNFNTIIPSYDSLINITNSPWALRLRDLQGFGKKYRF